MEITYKQLQSKVKAGARIRWCGDPKEDHISVLLEKGDLRQFVSVNITSVLAQWPCNGVLRNGGAINPMTDVGWVPKSVDNMVQYRNATILGINISGLCTVETGVMYEKIDGCSCGYDIELDLRGKARGGFPLSSTPILSIALWCTCGYKYFVTTLQSSDSNHETVSSSKEAACRAVEMIMRHQPLWLVGWNNYTFDNTVLAYNTLDTEYNRYFKKVKVGVADSVEYGYIMDLPGTYNVDPLPYMHRSPPHAKRHNTDFSLYGVAKELGTTAKTEMPDLYVDTDPVELAEYNINDCAAAVDVWIKSGLIIEIPNLALSSCCHIYDCCRYMTSVTARCPLSTEALSINMKIDWSECPETEQYTGGSVLDPVKGVHSNVAVCDFSSMYPTIMMDANISPETLDVLDADYHEYGDVWYDDSYVYTRTEKNVARFSRSGSNILKGLLRKFLDLRSRFTKDNPVYAATLKVVANSIYGSMGYNKSPIYNPMCAVSTTSIGRWCLALACRTFESCGMRVVYGDTDSCMVTSRRRTTTYDPLAETKAALSVLHTKLRETPFCNMNMGLEDVHYRMILVDKKKYCYMTRSGNVSYKGMSIVRRDALGLCKNACQTLCEILLNTTDRIQANEAVAAYINNITLKCIRGELSPSDVSKVSKRNQKRCYVYTGADGKEQYVPVDTSLNKVDDFDMSSVLESFRREVLRITVPCGLGSLWDIIHRSNVLF